ncbi:DUF3108 domain-containing protein [Kordiimonas aquimaris]|uniref:DUF3108 domain-containing protein n=1 Tax=Kordiimonas aquimaris TaxID=707591 RepID=UPI0021CE5826|nr:DUF3108 domain-containing protein [Kordiimonas aquimaris]
MAPRTILTLSIMAILGFSPLNAAENLKAEYGFYWKGILVASAETGALVGDDAYDLSINFRMRGIAKLFANGRSALVARGKLGDDGIPVPSLYSSEGRWDGKDYAKVMTFDANGALVEQKLDWPKKWLEESKREPIPEDMQVGPDPASVLIQLITTPLETAADGTPVSARSFDGDSVFEWQFSCLPEPSTLDESGKSPYAGAAHECGFSNELVAGKRILTEKQKKKAEKRRKKAEKRRAAGKEDESMPPKIWVQSFAEGRYMLPVRAEVSSSMGRIVMYLKNLDLTNEELPHEQDLLSGTANADKAESR